MWFWIQAVVAIVIGVGLIALYWRFRKDLVRYLVDHLGQTVILVLLYLIVYAQVGGALGVPYLFWNEEPVTRFFAAVGCTLLLALIGINAYYLIPEEIQVGAMERIRGFLKRWSVLKLPFGRWLEPDQGNAVELSQFLRVVRFPFLMLLGLPALLPLVFSNVPRYAPVGSKDLKKLLEWAGQTDLYDEWNRHPDVSAHAPAYLIGLAVWGAGLLTGVILIKFAIKVTSVLHPRVTRIGAIIFPRTRRAVLWLSDQIGGPTNRPSATRISPDKLESIITFFMVTLFCYVLLSIRPVYGGIGPYEGVAPAFAICALLGIMAMASAAIELMRPRLRLLAIALVLVWIGLANHDPYKLRFEKLPYYPGEGEPVVLSEAKVLGMYAPGHPRSSRLVDEDDLLPRWADFARSTSALPDLRPKLVVVCVSGGAIRSAYWSGVVLDRLDQRIDPQHPFHNHVRVITGASGGMVGTAYYVRWLYDRRLQNKTGDLTDQDHWYQEMPNNSLRKVARSLALRETWRMWVPRLSETFGDRGIALEKDWAAIRDLAFSQLKPLEEAGKLPSLIFSPMTVEDGRRLLITNLDLRTDAAALSALPLNRGVELDDENDERKREGKKREPETFSLSAVEFFKIFPDANDFMLATAARMSASFPWVSPAVNLPTEPPMRVVDAGYYDSYGVNVAGAWLHLHEDWIVKNTSGVVLVQIRDSVSRNDRLGFPEPESQGNVEKALTGFQFLFTPVDAVLEARTTSASFRDDQAVAAIGQVFTRLTKDPEFFTSVKFENSAEVAVDAAPDYTWETWRDITQRKEPNQDPSSSTTVAMSWYLTQAEINALENAIPDLQQMKSDPVSAKDRENWIVAQAKKVADAPLDSERRAELRRQLDRARRFDERVRNAERVKALKRWWGEDHSVKVR